ncbi:outer membrane protein [Novosphingobium sp. MBES04]|uniref:outer membrane protein n=1 Tax=Novosphingobium sp. MBES04 TaxID=1206458 RepID=UPI00057E0BC6|nr:outer membrane beta-barrel protein [Novosphingobium sp. MBES04]GAM05748.1 opacity protein and related surface antigens-like protein [Novosphingobium sp. MBES04]
MKKIALLAASAALFALPAAANAQAFVQVEGGLDVAQQGGDSEAGFSYGVSAGYDYDLSNGMFIGVQGTYGDSTARSCVHDIAEVGDRACLEARRDLAAVVRLGTQIGARNKLYVLGGYTNTRVGLTYKSDTLDQNLAGFSDLGAHDTLNGFRVGAGYEYDVTSNLFIKAEYRYSNYGSDFSRHQGVLAVGTKF